MRAAHGTEMSQFGSFLGKRFVMKLTGSCRVEAQVELVFPAEFKSRFAQGIIARTRRWMAFGQVSSMGRDFVCDHPVFDIFLVGQPEMLLGGNVAEHRTSVPADHGRANSTGNVVVTGRNIGRQRSQRVEWGLGAPLELLLHVLF